MLKRYIFELHGGQDTVRAAPLVRVKANIPCVRATAYAVFDREIGFDSRSHRDKPTEEFEAVPEALFGRALHHDAEEGDKVQVGECCFPASEGRVM